MVGEVANYCIPGEEQPEEAPVHTVWLWSHKVQDGAGHPAEHFDLISQDCKQNKKHVDKMFVCGRPCKQPC